MTDIGLHSGDLMIVDKAGRVSELLLWRVILRAE